MTTSEELLASEEQQGHDVEFERPFNLFASAGIAYRLDNLYSVSISPVDNTVQFETVSRLTSGFAFGLVWNPFPAYNESKRISSGSPIHYLYKIFRTQFAVALLVNIFQLSYSADQPKQALPIDVGFGVGYRNKTFLILLTTEFAPLIQPRRYFIDNYKDQNKQLLFSGSQEPVRTISIDDKSLFITKLYPAIGIKIAYAFSKNND